MSSRPAFRRPWPPPRLCLALDSARVDLERALEFLEADPGSAPLAWREFQDVACAFDVLSRALVKARNEPVGLRERVASFFESLL